MSIGMIGGIHAIGSFVWLLRLCKDPKARFVEKDSKNPTFIGWSGVYWPEFHSLRRSMAAARMTQAQLVRHLAQKCDLNNKVARAFLDELAKTALTQTKKNGLFVLPGIGRLVKSARKARMGRNPATGEAIKIPAKTVVKFRVAKAAKDAIVPSKKK
jgi:DNA-binding protein HU-beta